MTPKTRVLLLPVFVLGFGAALAGAFFLRGVCSTDGRESSGDKHEWSILQSLEAAYREQPISGFEFVERHGYHIVCVASSAAAKRVWIMLAPRNPPFYKQLPHDSYSLSPEQYQQIVATRHATSTVEEALSSHVQ